MGIKMKNRSTESSANEFDSLIEKRIDEQFNFELFMTTGQTDSKEYDYGVPEMIPVLLSSLNDERALDTEEQKSLFILWADRYFRSLFPLESHQSIWSEHSEELKRILNRAESLLIEMEPDISCDFISHKLQFEYQTKRGNGLISGSFEDLLQYMHVFQASLAFFMNDLSELQRILHMVLEDTKSNAEILLTRADRAESLLKSGVDGFYGVYLPSIQYWKEPLSWLYEEAQAIGLSKHLVPSYEEYVVFLKQIKTFHNEECRKKMMSLAEARLRALRMLAYGEVD